MAYESLVSHLLKNSEHKNLKVMVKDISKLLGMSEASIYNKFNGRSRFSIEELFTICQKSNISLDHLIHAQEPKNSYVPFYADGLMYQPRNYPDYFQNVISYFAKVKKMKNVHGYFLANEVPLFHLLSFPHLMYLKLFMWNRINWKIGGVSSSFDIKEFSKNGDLQQCITILKDLYYSFPDTEIWNPYMLDNTVSQYLYLKEIHVLKNKEDQRIIESEFMDLITYLEELTNAGKKPSNSKNLQMDCNIYINDINLGSEVILVLSEETSILFQQIDVPNYMRTTDQRMIKNQFRFIENIRKISTFITHAGEKERLIFFARLRMQLERF